MEKKTIREAYADFFKALSLNSVAAAKIDSSNVYQLANPKNRKLMDKLVEDNLLPESHLENVENFLDFYNQVKSGKSGLILMEHYSNTDLPALLYMLEHSGNSDLADLSKRTVAIAGMKLNEDNPIVRAFAESFTRVVIYPTRSLTKNEEKAQSEEEAKEEMLKARKLIWRQCEQWMTAKNAVKSFQFFRREQDTVRDIQKQKRGLREIDSYLRLFDIAICVSINGSILEIQDGKEDMLSDLVGPDKLVFTSSSVIECKKFRSEYLATLPENEPDPKQKMIDKIMDILEVQHENVEKTRLA